jgi:predicted nucleotide-binding protein
MSVDVFISYMALDRDYANTIVLALQKEGLTVWWDASLLAGQAWEEQIFKVLKEAQLILAIVSPASARQEQGFAMQEWWFALENNLRIAPVIIGDVTLGDDFQGRQLSMRTGFLFDESRPDESAAEIARRVAQDLRTPRADPLPGANEAPRANQPAADAALRRLANDAAATAREVSNPLPAGKSDEPPASIFVVHGHDLDMLDAVAAELAKLNIEPVILNRVRTSDDHLFAKFRAVANKARHAFVLIGGDDVGASLTEFFHPAGGTPSLQFRARQNVVLELGFFCGRLSEENVFVFQKSPPPTEKMLPRFELPSDLSGKIYEDFSGDWKDVLRQRLSDAGFATKV